MSDTNSEMPDELAAAVDEIQEQAEDLCHIHDHVTRVIANLDIDEEWFTDYQNADDAEFEIEGIVKLFLYKRVRGFSQAETARRLRGAAYVFIRFDLPRPPTQGGISYNWRNRLNLPDRRLIKTAADRIHEVCADHDIIDGGEPALDPDDIRGRDIEEEQIMDAVEQATHLGFDEFTDPRAENRKYALQAFFERQGYINMAKAGTTTKRRRFARLSDRPEVPHGSTHYRTMKKIADPAKQLTYDEFRDGGRVPDWKRIRDTVLPAFHAGVEKQLDAIAGRDRQGIRQPVIAALDITTFNHWQSPLRNREDVEWWEDPVETKYGEVYPRSDFPTMVSGYKKSNKKKTERGYKFATLTIVASDTPIILAIEPVRDYRWWERPDKEDVETTSRGELVERLLTQAEQHADIHKVFCDREFDVHAVRDALDRHTNQYVVGKQKRSAEDYENVEEIIEDPVYDSRIEHAWAEYEGREHKVSIIYLPGGDYSLFTVNGWVDPDRAEALTNQYRQRWTIENQYKQIKKHFLPQTATKDYRVRFLYFVIAVTLHNVWRLTNFMLRDEVDVDLGENPPIPAGELVELVGLFLFEPGG